MPSSRPPRESKNRAISWAERVVVPSPSVADIAVRWSREVTDEFHARFSARYRRYRYLVLTRAQRSALAAGSACLERRPLDAPRMHEAAQCLLGERDFSAFRGAGCQSRTPMRRLDRISVGHALG